MYVVVIERYTLLFVIIEGYVRYNVVVRNAYENVIIVVVRK